MHEEECGCCCGHDDTEESCCSSEEVCSPEEKCVPKEDAKSGPDMIRDILNFISVKKEEENEDTTTCIDPETAEELEAMLEKLAQKAAECDCD